MYATRNNLTLILLAPVLSLGVLGGMFVEKYTIHTRPADATPYHDRAAHAILEELPSLIGHWVGTDQPTIQEAVKLLRPNAILTRQYLDIRTGRTASLLIVQTRDTRDMLGHFPPVCYVNQGETMVLRERRQWQAAQRTIDGFEYHFEQTVGNQTNRKAVYNFMIAPRVGILPDMASLGVAERNHEMRHFGAAQVQVLVPAEWPQDERDAVFTMIMTAIEPIIQTLVDGEKS